MELKSQLISVLYTLNFFVWKCLGFILALTSKANAFFNFSVKVYDENASLLQNISEKVR